MLSALFLSWSLLVAAVDGAAVSLRSYDDLNPLLFARSSKGYTSTRSNTAAQSLRNTSGSSVSSGNASNPSQNIGQQGNAANLVGSLVGAGTSSSGSSAGSHSGQPEHVIVLNEGSPTVGTLVSIPITFLTMPRFRCSKLSALSDFVFV